jgi:hypothetical protein
MIPNEFLDQLTRRINSLLPANAAPNLEKNLRALLESAFARLDLVTREEFDAQKEVLQRTREKVELLQLQISQLAQKEND